MKALLVLRHAKSSWKDETLTDHERPLNKRGRRDAPRMGRLMRDAHLVPERILSSTALRARLTAEAAAEACGCAEQLRYVEALYHGTPDDYLEVLRGQPDELDRILVVGHNPVLEEFLERLVGEWNRLPTAALAHVSLPVERWEELNAGTRGRLEALWSPKELD
jgi:phosphohistidine phosphatase